MPLTLVGLSHRTAPVEVRERLALNPGELAQLLRTLCHPPAQQPACAAEAAILSTCNRFEVYALVADGEQAPGHIGARLSQACRLPAEALTPHLFHAQGEAAARHLLAVAAGLDSMILGEPQVLGQVGEAYETALACDTAGPVLAALFRQAIHCGKRARTETAISEHAVSVSHAAVELTKQIYGSLGERGILLIGAGEMAELAARNLKDNGAGRILVVNRSRGRAEALAGQFGGEAFGWEELGEALAQADIVICSAAAPHTVIHADAVRHAMVRRRQPLFLVDIAVPRNVDPDVGRIGNVYLYDIDDLQTVVQENLEQRRCEVPKVEAIVDQCNADYSAWFQSLDVASTIRDLRTTAERLRDEEIDRALRRLGPVTKHQEKVVRTLARNIVSKLLHSPTVRLKELAEEGNGHESADLLRDLFGLSGSCEGEGRG
jgi:glutamyl-tRNA reductase